MSTLLKVFSSRDKALVILCLEFALLALAHSLSHFDIVTATELNFDPDVGKSTVELVQARGYVVETHNVTTIDGYILSMHRLPKSYKESQADTNNNDKAGRNKPVVFVQHGMVASSFAWVCDSRNHSLAYVLADAGYDVWLGNNRGNTYSSSHVKYTTKDTAFWDFSWEDMGKFDMPAMLNYALETSGRETLALVGYSQGATQAFVAFAENQTLARSVSYYAALGPVAWLGNTESRTFKLLARTYFDKVLEASNQVQLFSHNTLLQEIIQPAACHIGPELCASGFALVVKSTENLNASRIGVYTSDVPSGTSVKSTRHYAQSIRENTFSAFDYGCRCPRMLGIHLCPKSRCTNKVKYGSVDPPDFPISSMKYPRTGLFTGGNDIFATRADIDQLRSALPSSTIVYEKEISSFGHLDFVWAVQANKKLYQPLLKQLEQYVDTRY
uniref:Partial AB-hydrolase lipase domain-containing protein n=1 Tax=Hyaloperonospora arabidopsidis (strain Emoy2) TaxID=559515 RepID=M4C2U8_HYAAE